MRADALEHLTHHVATQQCPHPNYTPHRRDTSLDLSSLVHELLPLRVENDAQRANHCNPILLGMELTAH